MITSSSEPQPALILSPHPEDALGIQGYLHHAQGSYLMYWGDGTVEKLGSGQIRRHVYPEPGAYTVAAGYEGQAILSRALIFVRSDLTPQLVIQAREDNPNIWELFFNETKRQIISWYQVNWGDGSDTLEIAGPQGASTDHGYRDGGYDLAVRDLGTMRWWRQHIDVAAPAQDPDVSWTYVESDTTGMTVEFTLVTKKDGKTVRLYWDENGLADEFTEVGQKKQHKYATQGSYIVQAVYTDGTGDGSAWGVDVPNPKTRGTKPASHLVIRKDALNPLATWTRWVGSETDYTLHFGDGESVQRLEWQPPVRHVYPGEGRYLVKGVNDWGRSAEEWLELRADPAPPVRPDPAYVVRPKDSSLCVRVRLCLQPPTATDPFDHRFVAHDISWGDSHQEHVPAGTPHVDHDYLPGEWSWPFGKPFPVVTVTDTETGRSTQQTVSAVRPARIWVIWKSEGGAGPVLDAMAADLPTQGPGVSYQVWAGGKLLRTQSPKEQASYFEWSQEWPLRDWGSASLVTMGGQELHASPLWHKREQGLCAYDWDWQTDPRLIHCTPWIFGTSTGPHVGSFEVTWGDSITEHLKMPTEEERKRAGDLLENPGGNPTLPHWYGTYGTYTLTITPDRTTGPTSRVIGPCQIQQPVLDPDGTVHIDFSDLKDKWHPVRIDWDDGTPITRQHPATSGNRLSHRYTSPGPRTITVYAPMQDPQKFTIQIKDRKSLVGTFSAHFTPASSWEGGYTASYRITHEKTSGGQPDPWEMSFTLDEPAVLADVWGGGVLKSTDAHRAKDTTHTSKTAEPDLAVYRQGAFYVIKSVKPLAPGESVDVGFRVEPAGKPAILPKACSVNGHPCSGDETDPPPVDKEPPTQPENLRLRSAGPKSLSLAWGESTDDVGVTQYEIEVDGDIATRIPAPASSGTVTGLDPQTSYELRVRAADKAGNRSLWSNKITESTTAPTPPGHLWDVKVAPYVDMTVWPNPNLADFALKSGVHSFTCAFIVNNNWSQALSPCWGGYPDYAVSSGWGRENLNALKAHGGIPVLSFGGENGTEIASVATDVDELVAAYKAVIQTYDVKHLDFDIEGTAQKDQAALERRSAALARLQAGDPELKIAFTLPVLPEGLTADGLNVIRTAVDHGVKISLVNIMSMVFYRPEPMGDLVIQSAESTHSQLAEFFPEMTAKQRWERLGVCPMIGMNNDRAVFSLDDADRLTTFAIERGLGSLTYWEAGRDHNACMSEALYQCTNVPQEPFDFAVRFSMYQEPGS